MSLPHLLQELSRKRRDPQFLTPFLRSIGLGAVVDRILGYDEEPEKPIEDESLLVALGRCGVHLLPCTVSLIIISLNLKGLFIGFELAGLPGWSSKSLALLQIAAKAQELLIVASLTTIVAYKVRYDLINGPGVPFGLVGSSSLFTQLSFFWSPAFFGLLKGKPKTHAALIVLVIVSGFIAATAGPAVAVLVIPRVQTWPAGGTTFFVNGTSEELWPSEVGLEHYMPNAGFSNLTARCTDRNAYTNALCPAGGYLAILHRVNSGAYWRSYSGPKDSTYSPMNLLGSGDGITVFSPSGQMEPYTLVTSIRDTYALESSAVAVHGPSAWVAKRLGDDWYGATYSKMKPTSRSYRYKFYTTMKSVVKTTVPAVRVVCSPLQSLNQSQREVVFPFVPDYGPAVAIGTHGKLRENRTMDIRDGTLDNLTFFKYPRIHRVDLSEQSWTNMTTGLLIEYPWKNNRTRKISGCVLDARWAKGKVFYEYTTAVQPALNSMQHHETDGYYISDMFRPKPDGNWRHINISRDVFHAVMFPGAFAALQTRQDFNTTAYAGLMTTFNWDGEWVWDNHLYETEQMIAAVFADALARTGSWRTVNPWEKRKANWKSQILTGREAYEEPSGLADNYTSFRMDQQITGYAFIASSIEDYLALGVVLSHLAIATGHIILVLFTQRSSACWDSIPELLTLAMQSRPSEKTLTNTATGIWTSKVYGQTSRIRVPTEEKELVEQHRVRHVELVLDADHVGKMLQKPKVLHKYG